MKTISIAIFILTINFCSAQTVYSLLDDGIGTEAGTYYKDTYNDFDKFVGTWKYVSGNIIFEITLQKKEMFYNPDFDNYSDMLVGEYRYIDSNGITIINTLPNLQSNLEPYKNNIAGEYIMNNNLPVSERKVRLYFSDPERDYLHREIIIKHHAALSGSPESISIHFTGEGAILPSESAPANLRVPEQDYTLIKVP